MTSAGSARAVLAWAAMVALVTVLVDGTGHALALGLIFGLFAVVAGALAPATARGPVAALVAVAVVGTEAQLSVGVGPVKIGVVDAVALAAAVAAARTARRVDRLAPTADGPGCQRFGLLVLAGALVLRWVLPIMLGGGSLGVQNGRISLPFISVQVGDLARIMVILGLGLVLQRLSGESAGDLRRALHAPVGILTLVLLTLNVLPLLVLDMGPAVLTLLGCLVVGYWAFGLRRYALPRVARRALLCALPAGVMAGAAVPLVRHKAVARLDMVMDPTANSQLGYALNAVRSAGLIGPGFGHAQFVGAIPLASTDMLPAAVAGSLGLLAFAMVVTGLLFALLGLYRAVLAVGGPWAIIGSALLATLAAQAAWSTTANLGLTPLTGVSAPVLTMTGSTALASGLVIGFAVGVAATGSVDRAVDVLPSRVLRRGLATAIGATVVGCVVALVTVAPPTSAARLTLDRGRILSSNGTVLAGWDPSREEPRTDLSPRTYPVIGTYSRANRAVSGLEARYNYELTCGGGHSWGEYLRSLVRPLPCHPADLVTTLDTTVQRAARRALDGVEGNAVVLDSRTGGVLSDFSTFSSDHTPEGPLGSVFKVVVTAAAYDDGVSSAGAPRTTLDVDGEEIHNDGGFTCPAVDIPTALKNSCNTVFGTLGIRIGQQRLRAVAETYFGADRPMPYDGSRYRTVDLGLQTGLDAPRRLKDVELARTSFGQQSVRATTLSVAMLGSTVLNGLDGKRAPAPHVVAGTCQHGELREFHPDPAYVGSEALPAEVAEKTYAAMRAVATGPTMSTLHVGGHEMAGKTGTADAPRADGVYDTRSWLMVTVDRRYVIAVQVYVPGTTHENHAAPVVDQLIAALPAGPSTSC